MKIKKSSNASLAVTFSLLGFLTLLPSPSYAYGEGSCSGGEITVCGVPIPMPALTTVGNTATVHVPPALLGDSAAQNPNVTFTVECAANGDVNGSTSYRVVNLESVSCTPFPCQASTVRLCETSIPIAGGTPLGGVLHMTMPAPFAHDPFTVECLGTSGMPPLYKIANSSSVTCAKNQ